MKTFFVDVHEVWIQKFVVEAEDKNEALQKILDGEGKAIDDCLEYSHTLDNSGAWNVEEVNIK